MYCITVQMIGLWIEFTRKAADACGVNSDTAGLVGHADLDIFKKINAMTVSFKGGLVVARRWPRYSTLPHMVQSPISGQNWLFSVLFSFP